MNVSRNFYRNVSKNTIIGIISTGLAVLLSALVIPLVVIKLGVDNWAKYSLFLLSVAILTILESTSQTYVLQKTTTANVSGYKYYLVTKKNLKFGAGLLLAIIATWVLINNIKIIINEDLALIISLSLINLIPKTVTASMKGAMLGNSNQSRYYIISTSINILRPLYLLVIILAISPSVILFIITYIFFNIIEMIIFTVLNSNFKYESKLKVNNLNNVDKNLYISLFSGNTLSVIASNIDKIIIFTLSSLSLAGEYTFGSAIAGLLYIFINTALVSYGPRIKELFLQNKIKEVMTQFYEIAFINSFIVIFLAATFYINSYHILSSFTTKINTANVIFVFLFLSGACFFNGLLWIPGVIATSTGKAMFSSKTNFIYIISYIVILFLLYNESKFDSFVLAAFISSILTFICGIVYYKIKHFKFSIFKYLILSIFMPLIFVAILLIPEYFLEYYYSNLYLNLIYIFLLTGIFIIYKLYYSKKIII